MRPQRFDLDVDAVDPDGLADNNASSGTRLILDGALTSGHDLDGIADNNDSSGTSLTLDGALVSGSSYIAADSQAHHISILDTATVDQSGATFIITGTNLEGREIIENVTGPASGATVYSSNLFKSVTSITISNGAACGTVDVGPVGVYVSVDGLAHQLDIIDTATTDQSGATFTITGTDADGKAQTEAVTGPGSGATVESSKYFKTVTGVTIASGAACGTVDMGTVDEAASKTIPLNHMSSTPATVQVDVTGTIDYDIQVTLQDPFDTASAAPFNFDDQEDLAWVNDGNFGAKTADLLDDLATAGVRAMRIVTNSYSATAELQVYVTQPSDRSS